MALNQYKVGTRNNLIWTYCHYIDQSILYKAILYLEMLQYMIDQFLNWKSYVEFFEIDEFINLKLKSLCHVLLLLMGQDAICFLFIA